MSFASSPYSAAGYSSPVRNIDSVPTLTINCGSVVSLSVVVVNSGDFSIAPGSSCYFPNHQRDFQISSVSSFEAVNWLRTFSFSSQTSSLFRPGSRIEFVGSTALNAPAISLCPVVTAIFASSTNYLEGRSFNNVAFSAAGRTWPGLKGGKIQPLDFVVQTKTALVLRTTLMAEAAFSGSGRSSPSWRSAAYKPATKAVLSTSSAAFYGRGYANATYTVQTESLINFVGQKGVLATASLSSVSGTAFISAMSLGYVPREPDAVIYVVTRQKSVFVRAEP